MNYYCEKRDLATPMQAIQCCDRLYVGRNYIAIIYNLCISAQYFPKHSFNARVLFEKKQHVEIVKYMQSARTGDLSVSHHRYSVVVTFIANY